MIESNTRIGTGALRDAARTERVKRAMGWQAGRYSACQICLCRDCRFGQFQGRRDFVCALASIKTQRLAKCRLFSPGQNRVYLAKAREVDATPIRDRIEIALRQMAPP